MSETIAEQIEDLRKAGVTVRRKAVLKGEGEQSPRQVAQEYWLLKWAANAFENTPMVKRATGVRFLAESCFGLPAFVVGVGPSLDGDIETLKQAQGHGIIVATDAAFRPLMAKGIRPDIVVSFDCKPEQSLLWSNVPPHDVPCLFDSCADPAVIKSWGGPILFYNHWHQTDEFSKTILPGVFTHVGQLPSGATVGNMAFFLSKLLGCSQSILVGFDFCYAQTEKGWRYRARDYAWAPAGDDRKEGWTPCEVKELYDNDVRVSRSFMRSVGGVEYRTDPELEYYAETFHMFRKNFSIETVNCAAAGMLATIVPTMTLPAAIERYCKKPYMPGRTVLPYLGHILADPRIEK